MTIQTLRDALECKNGYKFFIKLQPIVPISFSEVPDWEPNFFELLIGLEHPDGHEAIASDFLHHAECAPELQVAIDEWVLEQVSKLIADTGHNYAVNISSSTLRQQYFSQRIGGILIKNQASQHKLHLELPESVLWGDFDKRLFNTLADSYKLVLDDVGSPFSHNSVFSHVVQIPLAGLKIDIHMIKGLSRTPNEQKRSRIAISAIMWMALEMGMFVVAEGVETEDERTALGQLKTQVEAIAVVDESTQSHELKLFIQGYLVGRPKRI